MSKLYKLTDSCGKTRNGTQWGPGISHSGTGEGEAERKAARLREIKNWEAAKTFERILNGNGPRRWEVVPAGRYHDH